MTPHPFIESKDVLPGLHNEFCCYTTAILLLYCCYTTILLLYYWHTTAVFRSIDDGTSHVGTRRTRRRNKKRQESRCDIATFWHGSHVISHMTSDDRARRGYATLKQRKVQGMDLDLSFDQRTGLLDGLCLLVPKCNHKTVPEQIAYLSAFSPSEEYHYLKLGVDAMSWNDVCTAFSDTALSSVQERISSMINAAIAPKYTENNVATFWHGSHVISHMTSADRARRGSATLKQRKVRGMELNLSFDQRTGLCGLLDGLSLLVPKCNHKTVPEQIAHLSAFSPYKEYHYLKLGVNVMSWNDVCTAFSDTALSSVQEGISHMIYCRHYAATAPKYDRFRPTYQYF